MNDPVLSPPLPRLGGARSLALPIAVAALGYCVDVFDIVLFSVVRVKSLTDLGIPPGQQLDTGLFLFNVQMAGLLLGGIAFGLRGDRVGRRSVLFGSILLYSLANLANATVSSIPAYAVCRFVAGFGLAGELGAGVTLVSELMPASKRGYGTALVATVGVAGGLLAPWVGRTFEWRTAFVIGGLAGLVLLVARLLVRESSLFEEVKRSTVPRGDLRMFLHGPRALKLLWAFLVGLPTWFLIGIPVTLAPEVGKALGVTPLPSVGEALKWAYLGLVVGDLISGLLSQWARSRRWPILGFQILGVVAVAWLIQTRGLTAAEYERGCFFIGLAGGYWALFITNAAEQFGTNLRATVAVSMPNLARGAAIPITLAFRALTPSTGIPVAIAVVGAACYALALLGTFQNPETFGRTLDFVEK
jgi:MFS transporter, putative metabolite:H+ symporter